MESPSLHATLVNIGAGPSMAYAVDQGGSSAQAFTLGISPSIRLGFYGQFTGFKAGVTARYRYTFFFSGAHDEGSTRGGRPQTHDLDLMGEAELGRDGIGLRLAVGLGSTWLQNPSATFIYPDTISTTFRFHGLVLDVGYRFALSATLRLGLGVSANFMRLVEVGPLFRGNVILERDISIWSR